METPETIKNALRLCATPDSCGVCPYIRGGRCPQKNSDALAYIEQLEARLAGAAEPAAPKMFFDSMDELAEVQKDWQRRLGLTDWWIASTICAREDMELQDAAGESEVLWTNKCGTISLLRREDLPGDLLVKEPQELTLIHELLHFKFFPHEAHGLEGAYYEAMQHQLLEELAKALYMAKYNLKWDWFIPEEARHDKG